MLIELWNLRKVISIIIEDKNSPIGYSNQTNGYACSHPGISGYLIPVELDEKISQKFLNYGYAGNGWELDNSFYEDASDIMEQLKKYFCNIYIFELDESKLINNTESWVYLVGKKNKPENYDMPDHVIFFV